MPKTPTRAVRIADELWFPAQRAAERSGETVTAVITRCLARYLTRHPDPELSDPSPTVEPAP